MTPGSRDFSCSWEQCGKSFNRKSDLCRHYRIHSNERPYHCTFKGCNKSFTQRSALTVHSRTHTGEKPHMCGHKGCRRAFADSSSLARHRRIHTGERPFMCQEPTCERSFRRKTSLTKHQRVCHPPESTSPSDDATAGHFYQEPQTSPIPYDQNFIAQQPGYPQFVIPIHRSSPQQNVLVTEVPVQESLLLIAANHVPVTFLDIQHAQQQSIQSIRQQYEQSRPSHMLHGSQQPAFPDSSIAEGHPLAVSYDPSYNYERLTRPEGTKWVSLGSIDVVKSTHPSWIPSCLPRGPFSPTSFDTMGGRYYN